MAERSERPISTNRSGRPARISLTGLRDRLAVKGQEEGWLYCFVADSTAGGGKNNVPAYEAAWYEFVTHPVTIGEEKIDVSSSMTNQRVSISGGNGTTLYLMRVPNEIFEEEAEALQSDLDEKERAMFQSLNEKSDGRYGNVEVKQNKPLAGKSSRHSR